MVESIRSERSCSSHSFGHNGAGKYACLLSQTHAFCRSSGIKALSNQSNAPSVALRRCFQVYRLERVVWHKAAFAQILGSPFWCWMGFAQIPCVQAMSTVVDRCAYHVSMISSYRNLHTGSLSGQMLNLLHSHKLFTDRGTSSVPAISMHAATATCIHGLSSGTERPRVGAVRAHSSQEAVLLTPCRFWQLVLSHGSCLWTVHGSMGSLHANVELN